MARKKERGRPTEKVLPPRIDATPEEIADKFFQFPSGREPRYLRETPEYRCVGCKSVVSYPDVLDCKGQCSGCASAPT